jgi:putative PIN family toxin of toxin-antitoxin system
MRIFLDTNVLVSAVATRGLCTDVLREVLKSHRFVVSSGLLSELERALRKKIRVPEKLINEFLDLIQQESVLSAPEKLPGIALRDRDDLGILSAAWNGKSDLFITGDTELLRLGQFQTLEIISPRAFWDRLRSLRPARPEKK